MSGNGSLNSPWDFATALDAVFNSSIPKTVQLMDGAKYAGDFICTVGGGTLANPVIFDKNPDDAPAINGSLAINQAVSNTLFKNLLINDDDNTNRVSGVYGGQSGNDMAGASNEVRDFVITNHKGGGIYIEDSADTLVIDGCIILFNGWLDDGTLDGLPHGHGIYLHGGKTTIRNCIIYCNASNGIQVYGLVNHDDVTLENNICFATHEMWRTPGDLGMNYILSVGANAVLRNNCSYSVAGSRRANEISQNGDGILTDNYLIEGIYQYNAGLWAETSGNVFAPEASNAVKAFAVRGRLHVAIYNWELLNSVTVDVSSVFSPGASVNVRNVEDYFVDITPMTVSGGGTISIDMRDSSRTTAAPQGLSAPATMFPEFGCFVIEAA